MNDPYLVIGTGRCGTSTVARILHEKIGVYMGSSFTPADKNNPDGYYEDVEFVQLNYSFYRKGLDIQSWIGAVIEKIFMRQRLKRPWGIKNIRMTDLLGLYLSFFDNPKIIWCQRRKGDTIDSYTRCYPNDSISQIEELYLVRIAVITRLLQGRDYLSLDFTNRRDENEIERIIRKKWNL